VPSGLVVALASACARAARACAKAVAGPTLETAGEAGAAAAGNVGALVACADAELAGAELAGSVVGATLRRRRTMTVGWTRRISTSPRSARAERALLVPRSGVESLEVVGRWVGFSVGRCTGFIVYAICPFDLASTRADVGDRLEVAGASTLRRRSNTSVGALRRLRVPKGQRSRTGARVSNATEASRGFVVATSNDRSSDSLIRTSRTERPRRSMARRIAGGTRRSRDDPK
jgi:hypothetical protein